MSSSILVSTPSSAQLYNGYGSGDYFGSPSTTPSRINNPPSSPGLIKLRDCSKYIDC